MGERTCAQCGAPIPESGERGPRHSKFCSKTCRKQYWNARAPTRLADRPPTVACVWCGSDIEVRRVGPVPRFCGPNCRSAECNDRAKTDGRRDKRAAAARAASAQSRPPCANCGGPLKTSRQTYCTEDACRQVARAAELELKRRYAKAKYDADPRAGRARVAAMRAAWTPARRAAARAYAEARKAPVTCDVCGTQWSARDKGRTYQGFRCCSTMCRTFVQYGVWPKCDLTAPPVTGTCVRCGVEYRQRNEGQQYCNKACRTARIFSAGPCAWCREPFISSIWERSTSAPKWCSAQCRRDHKLFRWKSSTGELAITYQERLAVYMRDDWICHICGDPVNRAARVPELDAPTIDHVVATARGGAHAMDNWRTAHFYCNCYKRDLPLDEIA